MLRQKKDEKRLDATYAQVIEKAWALYKREILTGGQGLEQPQYQPGHQHFHDQLESILNSKVGIISEAIQRNLDGFEEAVQAIRSLWDLSGAPNEQERKLISDVMKILRNEEGLAVRRELLVTLLGGEDPQLSTNLRKRKKKYPK